MDERKPILNPIQTNQLEELQSFIRLQRETIDQQAKQIEVLRHAMDAQVKEIEKLKSEVRRLKNLKKKPKIRASRMNKDDKGDSQNGSGKRPGSIKRHKNSGLIIHKTEVVQAKDIPVGSYFKGYKKYFMQGIEINPCNLLFKLECWCLPDGSYKIAKLPKAYRGQHFSPELRAYILHQYHHQEVTQPLLLSQLREWGIEISSGQLNRILIEGKEIFHEEKRSILKAGLANSQYIQVDDTGARHSGKNGYCTHIGNELFAWFKSTHSKSRINFLKLLRQEHTDYVIDETALEYMKRYSLAPKYRDRLKGGPQLFSTEKDWKDYLTQQGLTTFHQRRLATEGALIASILRHGFNMRCAIISDDAGQFNVFQHALCWIHAERKMNELIPYGEQQIKIHTETRATFWNIYSRLKAYKKASTDQMKKEIEEQFDKLCSTKTGWYSLDKVLKKYLLNKDELLLVLKLPEVPLHNNLSENDIRDYVKKRKISGSTRSDPGRECRDTFTSLKKTCKKLGIKFWEYLLDRTKGTNTIEPLYCLIEKRAAFST